MLYGGYDHNIDKKGRLAIPSKLRADLGESFMICRGISEKHCLYVYPMSEWEKLVSKINELPMAESGAFKRFLFDGAFNVEFDTQGRILVPPVLREYASLEYETHIVGVNSNLEIWNKDIWQQESAENTSENIFDIARTLGL